VLLVFFLIVYTTATG